MHRPNPPLPWDVVIVLDGDPPRGGWARAVQPGASVIAADGGARHCIAEGVWPTVCVGDFDSLPSGDLEVCRSRGARVLRHPAQKDQTDFALALAVAEDSRAADSRRSRLLVIGGSGGRIDHELGNVMLLARAASRAWSITACMGDALIQVATPGTPVQLHGAVGSVVSLIPLGGAARGVETGGLKWQLEHAELEWDTARGLSNEIEVPPATVSVTAGSILVVEPETVPVLLSPSEEELE